MAFVRFLNRLFLGRYNRTSEARLVESSFVPAGAEVKRLMTILRAASLPTCSLPILIFLPPC